MGGAARYYLMAYNGAQCVGWAWVLQRLFSAIFSSAPVYSAVRFPLQVFQTLAILELLHALSGLVRASVPTTAVQLASRLWVLWGIAYLVPDARTQPAFATMVAAWALTEVPRYLYFAVLAHGNKPPYFLIWLRYSTFFPLYPLGASSEWLTVFSGLPYIRETGLFNVSLPNAWNFAFDYWIFCLVVLVLYLPGSLICILT